MVQNEPDKNGERGIIINTSASFRWLGQSVISAANFAVSGMTLPISRDLSSLGIRVVTISVGK